MQIDLEIDGQKLDVRRVEGHAGLSRLFAFEVKCFGKEGLPAPAAVVGVEFALSLTDAFEQVATYKGVILAAEREVFETGLSFLRVSLGPKVAALAIGCSSRVFQELNAVDIVKKVLKDAGVPDDETAWELSGSYPVRPYTAQYRESDWTFVERLCGEEGISYRFDLGDKTILSFTDDTTSAQPVEGDAKLPFHDGTGLAATRDAVLRVKREARAIHEAVRLRDYDFTKPKLALDANAGAGAKELYDVPGRFSTPAAGKELAKRRLEALRAHGIVTTGETSSLRILPGRVFEIAQHPVGNVNGKYLALDVRYVMTLKDEGGPIGFLLHWKAIPAETPHRPAVGPVTRSPGGPQTGVVVGASGSEVHPDDAGRLRVQFHWDREGKKDDSASTWMRVGQFPLGGSMVVPRVGWDVLVSHHQDDVDAPYIATHLYDGAFPVPYALPANKTRTSFQTATTPGGGSSNEIRFEDKKGSEEMFINASSDMNVVVGDGRNDKVGVNLVEQIGANLGVDVGSNFKIGVTGAQTLSVGGSETVSVSGSRKMSVSASEASIIAGSRTAIVSGAAGLEGKGGRALVVGGSMLGVTAADVTRMTLGTHSVSVAGAWIQAAATGVSGMTGGAAAETVGGAKISGAASSYAMSVKGALAETVGGAYAVAAGGNIGEDAGGTLAYTVGGAFTAAAPSIEVEADAEISIRCGGSTLKITPGSVEFKSPSLASPGAVVKKKGGTIEHN